jgi:aldehyde dehydrogenase (NAD+)
MNDLIRAHRDHARSAANRTAAFRIRQLAALAAALVDRRQRIAQALAADLGKPEVEIYAAEFAPVMSEISHAKRHLGRWMRWQRVGAGRWIIPSPYGAALIIGTWNYPVQLTLSPLVAAIAAGNGVTLKPSEHAPATAEVLRELVEATFAPQAVSVRLGGPDLAASLVESGYDKVFFTGSPRVGALVARAAAARHSSVTLELGGKSPAIIGPDCSLPYAARRIAWGKFLNCGQTCMAPDYLLVPAGMEEEAVAELRAVVRQFYGEEPRRSADLARIVNGSHWDRLAGLLRRAGLPVDGDRDSGSLAPTVVRVDEESPLLQEEIFGPILPVLGYRSFDHLVDIVSRNPDPLALYVFTRDRAFERRTLAEIDCGGAMVNDTIRHTIDPRLPFGGRGASGSGSYHGRFGFDAFSHGKGVARTAQGRPGSMRFPPYRPLPSFVRRLVFGI